MPRSWKIRIVIGALVVVAALTLLHRQLLPFAAKWLDIGTTPQKSDAVFVLLGDADVRPFVAAALLNTGLADEIIIAVNSLQSQSSQLRPGDEVFRNVLLQRGVPEDKMVIMGRGATNTMNEIEVLGEYLDQHPDATVTVVTSDFHTRRTRWSLQHRLGKRADRLRYVSAPVDDYDASNWWLYPYGFEYIMMEYVKLVAYWFLYGNAAWYLGAFLIVVVAGWRMNRRKSLQITSSPDRP